MYTAVDLLENWAALKASRDAGSHSSTLLLKELEDGVRLLPLEQSEILKLYFYYGYTQAELSTFYKKSRRNIGKIISKSINDLNKLNK
jgi:DNA-directed RNA polymerase specialized sigma24 family protein